MRSKVNNTYKYIKLMNKNSQKVYQLKMTTSISVFKYERQTLHLFYGQIQFHFEFQSSNCNTFQIRFFSSSENASEFKHIL